ncbi:hypothetical protein [Clostridium sp. Marseille-Q2269]|nr:hypothetical protein [Clostridium sp. Marseille-Q2269]
MKKKKDEQKLISLFDEFKRLIFEKSSQDERYFRRNRVLDFE